MKLKDLNIEDEFYFPHEKELINSRIVVQKGEQDTYAPFMGVEGTEIDVFHNNSEVIKMPDALDSLIILRNKISQ